VALALIVDRWPVGDHAVLASGAHYGVYKKSELLL
jgi:hypothetical protein